jgi:hypothetical protein
MNISAGLSSVPWQRTREFRISEQTILRRNSKEEQGHGKDDEELSCSPSVTRILRSTASISCSVPEYRTFCFEITRHVLLFAAEAVNDSHLRLGDRCRDHCQAGDQTTSSREHSRPVGIENHDDQDNVGDRREHVRKGQLASHRSALGMEEARTQ